MYQDARPPRLCPVCSHAMNTHQPLEPTALQAKLNCAECNTLLDTPVTLSCGHSVCTRHLHPASSASDTPSTSSLPIYCPVSSCGASVTSSKGSITPHIPKTSRGLSADAPLLVPPTPLANSRRHDVTLSKVIDVISRAALQPQSPSPSLVLSLLRRETTRLTLPRPTTASCNKSSLPSFLVKFVLCYSSSL